jgi:hypothetical protein
MERMTPELKIKLETKTVKSEVRELRLTVRNTFYVGFIGKIKTMWYWLISEEELTFKEYLDKPVTYTRVPPEEMHCYMNIDAEKELEEMLKKEYEK